MGPEHNEVWALPGCGLAFSLGERDTLASDVLPGVQPRFRDWTRMAARQTRDCGSVSSHPRTCSEWCIREEGGVRWGLNRIIMLADALTV